MNLSSEIEQKFPEGLRDILHQAGELADHLDLGAVVVGGGVRDLLLGKKVLDTDLMLEHPAKSVVEKLAKEHDAKLVLHDRFKTFTLHFPSGLKLDFTTARKETYPASAKLPDVQVSSAIKIQDDLKRRDFTVNALAFWVNKNKFGDLLDVFNGRGDLDKKQIRILHDQSFIDDPTRIFRAARFAGRYDFKIEPHTEKLLRESLAKKIPSHLSPARRRHEFELIMKEKHPVPALHLLHDWNALDFIYDGWSEGMKNISRMKQHQLDDDSSPLIHNLFHWFSIWGKEKSLHMMSELGFEKKIKKEVGVNL